MSSFWNVIINSSSNWKMNARFITVPREIWCDLVIDGTRAFGPRAVHHSVAPYLTRHSDESMHSSSNSMMNSPNDDDDDDDDDDNTPP